ncbi:ATP-binding cassette, subfamily C, CydCD [Kytococcus aerolatus]|uniref:ATP-binding cassette, subfamily C, CydCD n=1 Tax=Kytococcus aerolatus TaxID=592308 RepID=A0A212TEP6_9MICO|nr:thiol reductant ABC exporter subunit CydC [Kytococcus aerolatus]SNC64538.1 ATP-binding cassette, subfamily C, CydCD [Kytococcus aerolatus]
MKPFETRLLRTLPRTRGEVAAVALPVVLQGLVAVLQALAVAWLASRVVQGAYAALTGQAAPPAGVPGAPEPTIGTLGPWEGVTALGAGDPLAGQGVLVPALVVAVLLGLRGVLDGWAHHRSATAGTRVTAMLREALVGRWLAGGPGRSAARATAGVDDVEPYVAQYLPSLVAAGAVPVMVVLALLWVDPFSAVVVVLTLPLLPVFAILIGQHTEAETQRRWRTLEALAGHFLDVMQGLPTLVNLGRAEKQVRTISQVGQEHRRATVRTLRTAFLTTAALELLSTISVAIVAVFVGLRLADGGIGLMAGLAAILLAPEAYWPVRRVGADFHAAADGADTLADVLPLLEEPVRAGTEAEGATGAGDSMGRTLPGRAGDAPTGRSERPTVHPADGPLVTASDLAFAHPDGPETTTPERWTLPRTGLVAVTGPSGSGKTTLLGLLAGLLEPQRGSVEAPRTHLVTQRPFLPRADVEAALRMTPTAAEAPRELLEEAVARVGLTETIDLLPQGWATPLGDDGQGLSAGERARLGLARALLDDAAVLLLDEPTAHLDRGTAEQVHAVLRQEAERRLVVVVTHREELAAVADQRVEVHEGRVSAPEPVEDSAPPTGAVCEPTHASSTRPGGTPAGTGSSPSPAPPGGGPRLVEPTPRLWRAALTGALSAMAGVALTATSGWLIVRAWEQPNVLLLMVAIVGVRTFGIARPLLRYAERLDSHDVALDQLARRRSGVYERLVPLTPARLGQRGRARVLTGVVADLDDVVFAAVRWWVPALSAGLTGLAAAVALSVASPLVGLLVMLWTAAVLGGALWAEHATDTAHRREIAARGQVWEHAHTAAERADDLRAVNAQQHALDAVQESGRQVARWVGRRALAGGAVRAGTWLAAGLVVAVAAHVARDAGLAGPLTALLVLTPLALADVLSGVPEAVAARSRARAAAERLEELLGQEPAVAAVTGETAHRPAGEAPEDTAGGAAAPVVPDRADAALEQVTARWSATAEPVLRGLDLDLPAGRRVALTGPSGTGKSTALAVLARHLDPAGGCYLLDGRDALAMPLPEARAHVAVLDDSPHVFSSTLRENLRAAAPGADDERLARTLREAGLDAWHRALPQGLDTMVGAGHRDLSGGEQARLGIARMLLQDRPVVLLDEPVAHLDGPTASAVMGHLGRATAGRTVVLVSHREEGHDWCDTEVRLEPRPAAARPGPTPR